MAWNGLSLQNDLAALLGNTATSFKSRVLGWMNDIEIDIMSKHVWPFSINKGEILLTDGSEEQLLYVEKPSSAPTATISSGGSLEENSTYSVKVTFYQGSSLTETEASDASSTVTATAANKTISLTSIPTSSQPLVTARKIYVSTDGGEYYYSQTISDNTTTTATITTEPSSTVTPMDFNYFKRLEGQIFIESAFQLRPLSKIEMRDYYPGDFEDTSGTPTSYSTISYDKIVMYPAPSSTTIAFYYEKYPRGIYASSDSIPTIPRFLKEVLEAGVIWKGYRYRDRDGQQSTLANYNNLLFEVISKMGEPDKHAYTVRDVVGDSDGLIVN